MISAVGVKTHQLWMLWVGSGIIGGVGLGLGYISPVSTLIKWFPDRRGMATGMAIMDFGSGAMIGSPLANLLMNHFKTPTSVGVWETFIVLGIGYFVYMVAGAFSHRVPPDHWSPDGWSPSSVQKAMITTENVHLKDAHKTPQFWLIWAVLCLNVSAGIGIIGAASPMLQETFGGTLFHDPSVGFTQFTDAQKTLAAAIGGGFVGLFSLFNIGGRFFWATLSDKIGRKTTLFYLLRPRYRLLRQCTGACGHEGCCDFCHLLLHYGIVGPVIVNYLHDTRVAEGVPRDHIYAEIFYVSRRCWPPDLFATRSSVRSPPNGILRKAAAKRRQLRFPKPSNPTESAAEVSMQRSSWSGQRWRSPLLGASGRHSRTPRKSSNHRRERQILEGTSKNIPLWCDDRRSSSQRGRSFNP
jgi:Major Facilitator Superfamily